MATNRTRVYSAPEFVQRQRRDLALQPITVIGTTRAIEVDDQISFALDVDPTNWIGIPLTLIENIEVLGTVKSDGQVNTRVSLQLKEPQSPEGQVFALIAIIGDQTLRSVARKIAPLLGGDSVLRDACLDCIHRCQDIVLTEDDPFAQIICMLKCGDCPG